MIVGLWGLRCATYRTVYRTLFYSSEWTRREADPFPRHALYSYIIRPTAACGTYQPAPMLLPRGQEPYPLSL
jgi:hypothetical protein